MLADITVASPISRQALPPPDAPPSAILRPGLAARLAEIAKTDVWERWLDERREWRQA